MISGKVKEYGFNKRGLHYDSELRKHLVKNHRFLVLRDIVQSLKVVNVPRVSDLWDRIDDLETVLDYEREGGCYEDAFCKRKRSSNYEYMGTQYSVIMPGSSNDFIHEARSQRNCILNYEIDHAMGRTTILFVRKNKALDESFVTMEVRGGSIVQAKGKFNKKTDKEVMEFLEDYSKVMELKMRL